MRLLAETLYQISINYMLISVCSSYQLMVHLIMDHKHLNWTTVIVQTFLLMTSLTVLSFLYLFLQLPTRVTGDNVVV
jgi:hypothetical protein